MASAGCLLGLMEWQNETKQHDDSLTDLHPLREGYVHRFVVPSSDVNNNSHPTNQPSSYPSINKSERLRRRLRAFIPISHLPLFSVCVGLDMWWSLIGRLGGDVLLVPQTKIRECRRAGLAVGVREEKALSRTRREVWLLQSRHSIWRGVINEPGWILRTRGEIRLRVKT